MKGKEMDPLGQNQAKKIINRIALQRNVISTDEALMIGDSYSSDIAGAKAAGIDQIWVKGDGLPVTEETATYIVPKITDIMKIL